MYGSADDGNATVKGTRNRGPSTHRQRRKRRLYRPISSQVQETVGCKTTRYFAALCPAWLLRQGECKHILAARIACERGGGEKGPAFETNEVPKRPTYTQNWPAYNLAQREEKHRFQVLLHDLCAGLPEPERPGVRGRHPHTVADKLFAVCFKVYTTLSSRRFGSDLVDAHERGYLSTSLCVNKVNIISGKSGRNAAPVHSHCPQRLSSPRDRNRLRHGQQRIQRVQVRSLVR